MTSDSGGIARLGALLGALAPDGLPPGPREVAELLWLATNLPAGTLIRAHAPPDEGTGGETPPSPPGQEAAAADAPGVAADEGDAEPKGRLYLPDSGASGQQRTGFHPASLIRVAGAPALPRRRALARALRPLKRRVPSTTRLVLDEEATADRIADEARWMPVLVPAQDRWLDLSLVIDVQGDAATLWQPLGRELLGVLQVLGAFRSIRTYWLRRRPDGTPGLAASPRHAPRSAATASDPSGRTTTLLLTDGVDPGWGAEALRGMLRQWARKGPTAVVQTLPEHLWQQTALAPEPGRFRSTGTPGSSSRLHFSPYTLGSRTLQRGEIPVPVLAIHPEWLAPWAVAVAGTCEFDGAAVRLPADDAAAGHALTAPPSGQPVTFEDFLAQTQPRPFRLAAYLSAAPLNLAIMQLVQSSMLPDSPPSDLAEIVFSGILRKLPTSSTDSDPLHQAYEFAPGIREQLLSTLRRDEAAQVIANVSAYLERYLPAGAPRFTAAVTDADGPLLLPADAQHWAEVQNLVRRRRHRRAPVGSNPADDFLATRGAAGRGGIRAMARDAPPYAHRESAASPVGRPIREASTSYGDKSLPSVRPDAHAPLLEAVRRAAHGASGIVLVVGEPGSGRTDAITRALQWVPDDWRMWSPDLALTLTQGAPRVGQRTIVLLEDLEAYAELPGFTIDSLAGTVCDLAESTEQAPVLVLGTMTPSTWNTLVAKAQENVSDEHNGCRRLIARAEVISLSLTSPEPPRWQGEPSRTRLVVIANTTDPVRAGSKFTHLGTGFLLTPRLVLTSAHIMDQPGPSGSVKVSRSQRPLTAGTWVDCRVLWRNNVSDAALLLADQDLAASTTDSHFSTPGWAEPSTEALSPCHITGTTIAITKSRTDAYLTGTLSPTSTHPAAMYEFEPADALPKPRSFTRGMSGAPVFFGSHLVGLVAARADRSSRLRLSVVSMGTLTSDPAFTEVCSQYMPRVPRLNVLPSSAPAGDRRTSDGSATGPRPLRVFISYAHENSNDAHAQEVRSLALMLRAEGIEVRLDHITAEVSRDWTAWMQQEIETADVIVVIVSPAYKRQAEGDTSTSVTYEARLLRNELAHAPGDRNRLILPVLLPGRTTADLPNFLTPFHSITISSLTRTGIADLLAHLSDRSPATDPGEQARRYSSLADQYWDAGRHRDALAVASQAIDAMTRLASENPAAYQPVLVSTLVIQSDRLAETGRIREALQAARQAVEVSETLVQADPAAYRTVLATAWSTLSNRLADNGEREQALAAAERAATLRRHTADTTSRAYQSDLARSLSNLSNRLNDLGRLQEALDAINEAAGLYRHLAQNDPNTFLPLLATTLNNQSDALRESGRLTEAVNALDEAVDILRQFTRTDPDAGIPSLASALINLGSMLSQTRRHAEAVDIAREAVDLCRQTAEASPTTAITRLAAALHNFGLRLSEVGQPAEALAAIDEAIAIRRHLVAAVADAALPDLAQSLSAAAWVRSRQQGDLERALEEAREAVGVFRQLAVQRPDVFNSDLNQAQSVEAAILVARGVPDKNRKARASKLTGKVKWYNKEKGFGFLTRDDGGDVFVHSSALPAGVEMLKPGERVEFQATTGSRGDQARSVTVLSPSPPVTPAQREPQELAHIVRDLTTLLKNTTPILERGRYPNKATGTKISSLLRTIADQLDE